MNRPSLAEVVAQLDDETMLRTMREQLVRGFPSFEGAPERVKAVRDRLMREVEALPDLLEALEIVAFVVCGGQLVCRRCKEPKAMHSPERCEVAAALAKARGEQ